MFWFRRNRVPLTTFQRVDIELLMRRSIEVIGEDHVLRCRVVTDLADLSLDRSSPLQLLSSASTVIQDRLPPMRQPVELLVRDMEDLGYPALYQEASGGEIARITIASELLEDPLRTLVELACQYSSHFWHQVENPAPLDRDPRTTNLLPICCGLGILASSASLYDQQWSQAGYAGWSISRSGYYTAAEIGYALALLVRFQQDETPPWTDGLRPDSRVTMKQALQHFAEQQRLGHAILFDAEEIPSSKSNQKQLADWLAGDDPAFALAAGYALCKLNEISAQSVESAIDASRSGDRDLVPIATTLLGRGRTSTQAAQQRITELVRDSNPPTAYAAVLSAHALGIPLNRYRARIAKLLNHFAADCHSLLHVVAQQGRNFASFEPQICEHLTRAIQTSDDELVSALIECLCCIAEDPRQAIEKRIRSKGIRDDLLQRYDTAV